MIVTINILLILLINFSYAFRGVFFILGADKLPILLTVVMIGVNILFLFHTGIKRNLIKYYLFISIGLLVLCLSVIKMGIVTSTIGFSAFFFNLVAWVLAFNNIPSIKHKENIIRYINVNVLFALINAILGIYQYFVDPTIFGLAFHEIYGNDVLMNSGRFLRRVTGLVGSPQNYSLYLALVTGLLSYSTITIKKKCFVYLILILGGLLSGSRAYSIFLAIFLIINLIYKLVGKNVNIKEKAKSIKLLLLSIIAGFIIINVSISNSTISRLFVLFSDWPALNIFVNNLKSLNGLEILTGKGLGYNERLVSMFFSTSEYKSFESYILSLFIQSGLIGLVGFIGIYFKALRDSIQSGESIYFALLCAIFINILMTPSFNGLAMSFIIWPFIIYPINFKSNK